MAENALRDLPPLASDWFAQTFAAPTAVQVEGWQSIASGSDTLIAAPTGSGKTLAAFLWALGGIVEKAARSALSDRVEVIYVSPLKALGNDISKNLEVPLSEMKSLAKARTVDLADIRVAVRTGDTPASDRQRHLRHPPHILITTPESLYILLTAARSRDILRGAHTVIVDEIHALAPNKRGSHLALSLERLQDLCDQPLQRIGLSATQRPVDEVARFLVGTDRIDADGQPRCRIVDAGHRRELDLRVETAGDELGAIASHELRARIFDRMAELIAAHRTTIVFSDTRRMVERVAHELGERLGDDRVAAHHGSLSRETRLRAEQRLKSGEIPVIVASASLELGIDVGHVDLVCQLGAPRALATLVQRVGRSGHCLGATPRGRLFPTTRDELLQCAAAVRATLAGELDRLDIPRPPRDILAQQIVAHVASALGPEAVAEVAIDDVWKLVRAAYPYRDFARADFDDIVDILADGVSARRGRRTAYLHRDGVNDRLRPRRGARLAAITNGGAIPDIADYDVVDDATDARIGTINEDFAIESLAGDIFLLGNHSWKIRRVEASRIRVTDANGQPPSIPFWLGEAPARTRELSAAVAELRQRIADQLDSPDELIRWLVGECHVDRAGAEQLAEYVGATSRSLGAVPTLERVIAERFFDEAGGMQLVLHTPFGGRINRALGLALRKRFCVSFDFELQAAATDDGVVLSLGEQHSFALDSVFSMLNPHSFEDDLVQAALVSPMFTNRWRWNATRALALPRFSGGRKVPMPIQRMRAEDLLAAVFPAQLACGDNRAGPIEVPHHPLIDETLDNCLHEAMDVDGLREVLVAIDDGRIETRVAETPAPSPMSHEILNANPYAFLDDAPLEERRARAVNLRRSDPELSSGIGALSADAIREVRQQAWPTVRDADEAHDALLSLIAVGSDDTLAWTDYLEPLMADGRVVCLQGTDRARPIYAAVENLAAVRALWPQARVSPATAGATSVTGELAEASYLLVRGWMECIGPTTAEALAARIDRPAVQVRGALLRLEGDGVVLRGTFSPGAVAGSEYCDRGLLARIHRRTLKRLRREIEPVSPAELMRFFFRWQHVEPSTRLHGRTGLATVIAQLEGLELAAHSWESSVLPSRIANYQPALLDDLCLSGEVTWGRLTPSFQDDESATPRAPSRTAVLSFFRREKGSTLLAPMPPDFPWRDRLGELENRILAHLERRGASFVTDICRALESPLDEIERALWNLVATGIIAGDGFAGLRNLINRRSKGARTEGRHLRAVGRRSRRSTRSAPSGRWSILRAGRSESAREDDLVDQAAERVLRRYGIVIREVCARDRSLPPWRLVLRSLRRLEARGLVRGGRFVSGFPGEQFAIPEAVATLRSLRRSKDDADICIAAADPLNLTGIVTAGPRVSSSSATSVVYRSGVPVADAGTYSSAARLV